MVRGLKIFASISRLTKHEIRQVLHGRHVASSVLKYLYHSVLSCLTGRLYISRPQPTTHYDTPAG